MPGRLCRHYLERNARPSERSRPADGARPGRPHLCARLAPGGLAAAQPGRPVRPAQPAQWYVDLRRILLDGRLAPLAGRVMLDLTADLGYDAAGGLTLGADPVATAMMHAAAGRGTPVDAFVVRKREKEHGTQRRIEGPDVAGRRVLVVEDTSTTGTSPL